MTTCRIGQDESGESPDPTAATSHCSTEDGQTQDRVTYKLQRQSNLYNEACKSE